MYLSDTLIDQITQSIMEKIHNNEFPLGTRLPSVRKHAKILEVSNETVLRAYDKLVVMGYLEARRGSGFYVIRTQASKPKHEVKSWLQNNPDVMHWQKLLYANDLSDQEPPNAISVPQQSSMALIENALANIDSSTIFKMSQYANPQGFIPLRAQIAEKLTRQGIDTDITQVMTACGATDALHLIIWSHFFPGEAILVEEPCSPLHIQRAMASGLELYHVPRMPDGPDLEIIENFCIQHKPKAFLMSSILHNPTSSSLSIYKAHQLIKLAEAHDFFIVDDDSYGDLMPDTQMVNITRLANLDQYNRVIQIGSFSKTISPGLRVGYIAAKAPTIQHILLYKSVGAIQSALLNEAVVCHILKNDQYKIHCANLIQHINTNRQKLIAQLAQSGWDFAERNVGAYLWAKHPDQNVVEQSESINMPYNIAHDIFTSNPTFFQYVRFNLI